MSNPPDDHNADNAADWFPEITVQEIPETMLHPGEGAGAERRRPPRGTRRRQGPRAGGNKTYTLADVGTILGALRSLPAKDRSQRRLDKQQVIRHLLEEITALQTRGYTLVEIAKAISSEGVEISSPALKTYVQRLSAGSCDGGGTSVPQSSLPLLAWRIRA